MTVILITGAAGNIGRKLQAAFAPLGWHLRLLDLKAEPGRQVIAADITAYEPRWVAQFQGVDTVIHLAANGDPWAQQAAIIRPNWDGTENVFRAAHEAKVKRVIFASSNWVMAGYRGSGLIRTPGLKPWPINPYGVSKLHGERVGATYAALGSFSFIACRIGWIQAKHDNQPGAHMGTTEEQYKWISTGDFVRAMIACVQAPMTGAAVVNLMSRNPGMPWSLDETTALLGDVIKDGAPPVRNFGVTLKEWHEARLYCRVMAPV